MAIYYYLKNQPPNTRNWTFSWRFSFPSAPPLVKSWLGLGKYFSLMCILVGLIFLANALLPIGLYELRSQQFKQQIISPVTVLGDSSTVVDYSNPQSWFPTAPILAPKSSKITHYTLSIPKLKIQEATVEIGGKDLMKSLVQYPGTALPGQFGNAVVYGHSVLPQFFNPNNYRTIFSTLPTLSEGDEIIVNFDGIEYTYRVYKMIEVPPDDVSVLEQQYDSEYLTLITCVPPGTYLRRLIVRARLERI